MSGMPDLQQYPLKGLYVKFLSMQKWQCPIYNWTLATLIWWKMWRIPSFFSIKKCLFLWVSHMQETKNKETKTLISNSYLIRQSFQGYRCKSGIVIIKWRVTWNYATVPLSLYLNNNRNISLLFYLKILNFDL